MKRWAIDVVKWAAMRSAARLRTESDRFLFWSVYYPFNFGDWIGPYLYRKWTGREPIFALPHDLSRDTVYMTAGSILARACTNCIVWGSGVLRDGTTFPRPWRTLAVRGPLSRKAFLRQGYPCPEVFGDPAVLLPLVHSPPREEPAVPLGLVPHFRDHPLVSAMYAGRDDVRVIDVRFPVEEVIRDIRSCERIASSSLHGLIVAHAYGVPATWVRWKHLSGDGTKYRDYFQSVETPRSDPVLLDADRAGPSDALGPLLDPPPPPRLDDLQAALVATCPFARAADGAALPG